MTAEEKMLLIQEKLYIDDRYFIMDSIKLETPEENDKWNLFENNIYDASIELRFTIEGIKRLQIIMENLNES